MVTPLIIDTPFGPFTVDQKWYKCANGDLVTQFVDDGIIYKHVKRDKASNLPDEVWHQHGQLEGVPTTRWFYAYAWNTHGRTDTEVRAIAVASILRQYRKWSEELDAANSNLP